MGKRAAAPPSKSKRKRSNSHIPEDFDAQQLEKQFELEECVWERDKEKEKEDERLDVLRSRLLLTAVNDALLREAILGPNPVQQVKRGMTLC